MIPSVVKEAGDDPALRGAPLALYVWLCSRLEPYAFRPVKTSAVAFELRIRRHSVGRALTTLVELGYLAEGPGDGAIRTFRLLLSRNVPIGPVEDHSRAP